MELWAGGGRAGGAGCSNLSGSNQRGTSVLWVCVTLVVVFGEAQRLISSQAGFCVSYAHLSEIFFYQLLYLKLHPDSGEPLASCSKSQSSFTTLPWQSSGSLSMLPGNIKMPYLF